WCLFLAGPTWQFKAMKEMYLPDLSDMHQKIAIKLQQHDSLPQQQRTEQTERPRVFKSILERMIQPLQLPKRGITPGNRDKLGSYEKQIIQLLSSTTRNRKPPSALQQEQPVPPSHIQTIQQSQSQTSRVQSHEDQMNPQLQPVKLQNSVTLIQLNNTTNVQHNLLSSLSASPSPQQNMMNSLQPTSNLDSGQGGSSSSLQQVAVGSLQQNPVSAPQQASANTMTSQSAVNVLQSNVNQLQANSSLLQQQHRKHQPEQHLVQSQQLKQLQQSHQMHQQMMQQKQQMMQQCQQQLHQQTKQQQLSQIQGHQMPQIHQMNEVNDMKMRQMGVKPGAFHQHHSAAQRTAYHHQQTKPGASFPILSPQLLQAASPQIPQNPSPQIDRQNLLTSLTKAGTPLQSGSSPFVVPPPPSPMPGDSEKVSSGVSSLANAGNSGHQQTSGAPASAPSLAIGTPGCQHHPCWLSLPLEMETMVMHQPWSLASQVFQRSLWSAL
ncbi:hypothetical protein RJ641_000881, partial [Dillenia turbinata]